MEKGTPPVEEEEECVLVVGEGEGGSVEEGMVGAGLNVVWVGVSLCWGVAVFAVRVRERLMARNVEERVVSVVGGSLRVVACPWSLQAGEG